MLSSVYSSDMAPSYGILDPVTFARAIDYDSIVSVKFVDAVSMSTFPVEQGSFGTYNKSSHPYKATVRIALNGDQARRDNLLLQLRAAVKGTADRLVNIVTPDGTYTNASLVNYEYHRDAKHAAWGMVVADLHFEEVRIVNLQYTSTVSPGAAPSAPNGKVQQKLKVPAINQILGIPPGGGRPQSVTGAR